MNLDQVAAQHYEWVERMGWHNKSVLESLALIGSELGEVAGEYLTGTPTEAFGEELADVILRSADLAQCEGVSLSTVVAQAAWQWESEDPRLQFYEILRDFGNWVNTARGLTIGPDFAIQLGLVVAKVIALGEAYGVNFEAELERKMRINEARGTRGRRV